MIYIYIYRYVICITTILSIWCTRILCIHINNIMTLTGSPFGLIGPTTPGEPFCPFIPLLPVSPESPVAPFSPLLPFIPGIPLKPVVPVLPFSPFCPLAPLIPYVCAYVICTSEFYISRISYIISISSIKSWFPLPTPRASVSLYIVQINVSVLMSWYHTYHYSRFARFSNSTFTTIPSWNTRNSWCSLKSKDCIVAY